DMSVNQQRKKAMRRLALDLEELTSSPVQGVSASPLDDDLFEWHCNIDMADTIWHLILFFPDNYPYSSPSAEFLPPGFQYTGGSSTSGRKGVKVCLSIFSDYENYHREWANETAYGWTAAYSVQTVLLNLLTHLGE
ncbi:hypothetical protein CAPTEDRAFT_118414, partial [Capitella teleta]